MAGVARRGLCCRVTVASSLAPEPPEALLWLVLPKQAAPEAAASPPPPSPTAVGFAQPDLVLGPSARLHSCPASGSDGCSADTAASASLRAGALPCACCSGTGGSVGAVLAASAVWLAQPLLLTSVVTASAAPPLLSLHAHHKRSHIALKGRMEAKHARIISFRFGRPIHTH